MNSKLILLLSILALTSLKSESQDLNPEPLPTQDALEIQQYSINTNYAVGGTPSMYNCNSIGDAVYTIPIHIPDGISNMKPELSFQYNSSIGVGLMGINWSLKGLSKISRTSNEYYYDAKKKGLTMLYGDLGDRFTLDGERLILTTGNYGSVNSEYRLEYSNKTKIRLLKKSSVTNAYCYFFVVEYENGLTYEYGTTDNSRLNINVLGQPCIYEWYVEKIYDRNLNLIEFEYITENSTSEKLISAIKYTGTLDASELPNVDIVSFKPSNGNSTNSNPGNFSVNFEYVSYNTIYTNKNIFENVFNNTKFIKNVIIKSGVSVVKKYSLDYSIDNTNAIPNVRLVSIQESDGNTLMYHPISINWNKGFDKNEFYDPPSVERGMKLAISDVNGDGISDIINFKSPVPVGSIENQDIITYFGKPDNSISTITSTSTVQSAQKSYSDRPYQGIQLSFTDFNDDRVSDILMEKNTNPASGSKSYSIFNSTGFNLTTNSSQILTTQWNDYYVGVGQFQNDSYNSNNDIIVFDKNAGAGPNSWEIYVSGINTNKISGYLPSPLYNIRSCEVQDFNNDGISEFVVICNSLSNQNTINIYNLERSGTNYVLSLKKTFTFFGPYESSYFADFSGDGFPDFVTYNLQSWNYYINQGTLTTGTSSSALFSPKGQINLFFDLNGDKSRVYLQDFDGDGSVDFGRISNYNINSNLSSDFKATSLNYLFTNGNGSIGTLIIDQNLSSNTEVDLDFCGVGDFNGDHQADLLVRYFYHPILQQSTGNKGFRIYYFKKNRKDSELVKSIVDSYRKRTTFVYSSFEIEANKLFENSNSTFYTKQIAPNKKYLKTILTDDKYKVIDKMAFDFNIPAWNYTGKGFLGFMINSRLENNTVKIDTNEYFPSKALLVLKSSTIYSTNTNSLLTSDLLNRTMFLNDINVPFAKVSVVIQKEKKFKNNSEKTSTKSTYVNDVFGDVTSETTLCYNNYNFTGQAYKTSISTYTYSLKPNIYLHFLTEQKSTHTINAVSESTKQTYDYSALGNLTEQIVFTNNFTLTKTNYTYDARGRMLTTSISNSDNSISKTTTINSYELLGRYPRKVTNPIGQFVVNDEYDVWGNVKKYIDENGLITVSTFSSLGWLTKKTMANPNLIEEYNYSWSSNYADNILYTVSKLSTGKPNEFSSFDIYGREVLSGIQNNKNQMICIKKEYYIWNKNIKSISEPFVKTQSPTDYTVYQYYTTGLAFGKILSITAPIKTLNYDYNGSAVSEKNVSTKPQKTTTKEYNVDGTLKSVTNTLNETIGYTYFMNSKLKQVSSANVISSVYEYDTKGLLKKETNANHGMLNYTYNDFQQLVEKKDAKNNIFTYAYDLLGRLLSTNNVDQGLITYGYDNALNAKGKLISISNALTAQSQNFTYDVLGRVIENEYTIDNTTYSKSFGYDDFGNLQSMTYPNQFKVNYSYSTNGYLQAILDDETKLELWRMVNMNTRFQITLARFGNQVVDNRVYDNKGMLTQIFMGSTLNIAYQFDQYSGNLMKKQDISNGFIDDYTYDNVDRLTSVSTNYGMPDLNLTYNSMGNIVSKSDVGDYLYHPIKTNAVERISNISSYLPTTEQNVTYNYNNKPVNISEDGNTIQLTYGLNDNRIKTTSTINGVVQTKLSIDDFEVVSVNGTSTEKCYVYGPTGLIAICLKNDQNPKDIYYVHKDHLGSIMAITNDAGTIVERRLYDAWGRPQNPIDGSYDNVPEFSITDKGYTSHEHYSYFGIINMNGRLYDPLLGRFFSPDPYIQDPENLQSFNQYSYVFNNPLKYTDPSGYLSAAFSNYDDYFESYNSSKKMGDGYLDYKMMLQREEELFMQQHSLSLPTIHVVDSKIVDRDIFIKRIQDGLDGYGNFRNYGGDGSGSPLDRTLYFVDQINQFNPIAHLIDDIVYSYNGTDRFGNRMTLTEANLKALSVVPIPIGKVGSLGASAIIGFTEHGINQAITRGFTSKDILQILREGEAATKLGRYGLQTRYMLGGNTIVLNAEGKLVTVFSNAENGIFKPIIK